MPNIRFPDSQSIKLLQNLKGTIFAYKKKNVMCHMSHVTCHMSSVTCHLSLKPRVTAKDLLPATPPLCKVGKDPKPKKNQPQKNHQNNQKC